MEPANGASLTYTVSDNLQIDWPFCVRGIAAGTGTVKVYADGKERFGITNVGRHPTVLVKDVLAETYIFDFDADVYGKELKIEFLEFIRKETTFDSLEALKTQVNSDIEKAKLLAVKKYS